MLGIASSLARAEAWLYQLQNPDSAQIAASGFHHAIIDYSRDGSEEKSLSASDVAKLHAAGVETIAYFSIGEAEDYRAYWLAAWKKQRPVWLGKENPDWRGNFTVRYWAPEWREKVLRPYLEKLVARGYDGVYLDIVDGFEYWGDPDTYQAGKETRLPGDPKDEAEAARRMIELVGWVAETSRRLAGEGHKFLIFPQNGERLLEFDAEGTFLKSIDGAGVESLWFERTKLQSQKSRKARLALLRQLKAAGKRIVVTDYIDDGTGYTGANKQRIDVFLANAKAEGFGWYIARKNQALEGINRVEGLPSP